MKRFLVITEDEDTTLETTDECQKFIKDALEYQDASKIRVYFGPDGIREVEWEQKIKMSLATPILPEGANEADSTRDSISEEAFGLNTVKNKLYPQG